MPLLKNGDISVDDWIGVSDDDTLPETGDIIISFDRYAEEHAQLASRKGRIGVAYANDRLIDDIVPALANIDLVVLSFPAFTDGRAYSQARSLRHQHNFEGEIRANGNVLPDQISLMTECGFDAFEIEAYRDVAAWKRTADAIGLSYQNGYGTRRKRPTATVASSGETQACG